MIARSRSIGAVIYRCVLCGSVDQSLSEEDALMVRRIVEPGEFLVTEFRIEIRPLKRKRVEKGGVTAKFEAVPLGFRQQPLADAAAPQILVHPQQIDEQPAGIAIPDDPGPDRCREGGTVVAQKDPEIGPARVAQKRCVVQTERFVDELPAFPRGIFLEAEAQPRRQIHRKPRRARERPDILYRAGKRRVTRRRAAITRSRYRSVPRGLCRIIYIMENNPRFPRAALS